MHDLEIIYIFFLNSDTSKTETNGYQKKIDINTAIQTK